MRLAVYQSYCHILRTCISFGHRNYLINAMYKAKGMIDRDQSPVAVSRCNVPHFCRTKMPRNEASIHQLNSPLYLSVTRVVRHR